MHGTNLYSQRGFIALISAIVVSFVLLIAVVSLGMRGITGRFYLLDVENKSASQGLAESCVNVGIIKVANDPEYNVTNVVVNVGINTCTLLAVTANSPSAGQSTIKAVGVMRGATTYLKVVVNAASAVPILWVETPNTP